MKVVLVPVTIHTSAAQLNTALCKATELYHREGVRIHLLSVQPLLSVRVSELLSPGEMRQFQLEEGHHALNAATDVLKKSGVPFYTHVEIGRSAETIVRISGAFHCDLILMGGQPGSGGITQKLFGSLASQVRHLLDSASASTVVIV